MHYQTLLSMASRAGEQYRLARTSYAEALNALHDDTPDRRLAAALSGAVEDLRYGADGDESALLRPITAPYTTLPGGFVLSFERDTGFSLEIGSAPLRDAPGLDGSAALLLAPSQAAGTAWLALECAIPWTGLRQARRLSFSLFGCASAACEAELRVFYWDVEGERHNAVMADGALRLPARHGVAQAMVAFCISRDIRVDEAREPVFALFLNPAVARYTLADISLAVGP